MDIPLHHASFRNRGDTAPVGAGIRVSRATAYRHRHGSQGHGADHLLPAIVSPFLVLAVRDGRPVLGTWQSVVIVDFNADNPRRQLRLSFVAG